jgi:hypothetical protein
MPRDYSSAMDPKTIVCKASLAVLLGGWLAACTEPLPPRTVEEYESDDIARIATLERCNADRAALLDDPDCINARRAAERLAAAEEEARRAALEEASRRQREEARRRQEALDRARREAEEARVRAEQEAYEQLWTGDTPPEPAGAPAEPDPAAASAEAADEAAESGPGSP